MSIGWPVVLRKVVGHSMEPELMQGQYIIVSGWITPRIGMIVVARADGREVIKRIVAVHNKTIDITGDNRNHTETYTVSKNQIIGVRFL